jgi:toxin ParE1/3/4
VAKDNPEAAERLAIRILTIVQTLREHPYLGHTGVEPGVRELVVGGAPYLVLYRIIRGQIRVLTIWHGAQSRKT